MNSELERAKDDIAGVFNIANLASKGPHDFVEVKVEQVCKIQNSEAIYGEYLAQIFFALDDVWDPNVLQNDAYEETPLGSVANYRTKCLVSELQTWVEVSKINGTNRINVAI